MFKPALQGKQWWAGTWMSEPVEALTNPATPLDSNSLGNAGQSYKHQTGHECYHAAAHLEQPPPPLAMLCFRHPQQQHPAILRLPGVYTRYGVCHPAEVTLYHWWVTRVTHSKCARSDIQVHSSGRAATWSPNTHPGHAHSHQLQCWFQAGVP